jgi:hypothetical protein
MAVRVVRTDVDGSVAVVDTGKGLGVVTGGPRAGRATTVDAGDA